MGPCCKNNRDLFTIYTACHSCIAQALTVDVDMLLPVHELSASV
jgi:hypothetical protein